jgi:S1-C subfamily serine protease
LTAPAAALSAGTVFDALEATLGEIYEGVTPSVVNIQVQSTEALSFNIPQAPGEPFDPSMPQEPMPQEPMPQEALGLGFVWEPITSACSYSSPSTMAWKCMICR